MLVRSQVSSSLWSNVSKVTSLEGHSVMSKVKVPWVSQWVSELVTRSPIELLWTAKKEKKLNKWSKTSAVNVSRHLSNVSEYLSNVSRHLSNVSRQYLLFYILVEYLWFLHFGGIFINFTWRQNYDMRLLMKVETHPEVVPVEDWES